MPERIHPNAPMRPRGGSLRPRLPIRTAAEPPSTGKLPESAEQRLVGALCAVIAFAIVLVGVQTLHFHVLP